MHILHAGAAKSVLKGLTEANAKKRAIAGSKSEPYDRLTRKDFWNDPDRWEGVDDPRKTMFWEVRRRDVIDVRPSPKKVVHMPQRPVDYTPQMGLINQIAQHSYMNGLNQYRRGPQTWSQMLFGW